MANGFNFDQILKNVEAFKRAAPAVVAQEAHKHFVKNFDKEGYDDKGFVKWPDRKHPVHVKRKLLVKTGRLRESIRIKNQSFREIRISTAVAYAVYQNSGTSRIPARPFLYNSEKLEKRIKSLLLKMLKKCFE